LQNENALGYATAHAIAVDAASIPIKKAPTYNSSDYLIIVGYLFRLLLLLFNVFFVNVVRQNKMLTWRVQIVK